MATASSIPSIRTMLLHAPFRTLWLAQFVSVFGDFLALFGVINLITFRLHGNAVQVTMVTIAYVLPLAIVSPPAGVFVDRWNVKWVMISSDLMRAGLVLLLVFVTDVREIAAIFAALSVVSSFFAPSQSVALRTLVPPEGLLAANALMAQAFYTVRILSPAAAGALVSWLSEKSCFYLDAFSFVFSAAMIFTLVLVRPAADNRDKSLKSLTADFLAGNRFIFTHAGLAFVFGAMAVAMFILSSFSPLFSIFIRDSLGGGPFAFGVISSMVGVGMIAGSQVVTHLSRKGAGPVVVLGGLASLGAGAGLLGVSPNTILAGVSTFLMGFAIAFVLVPAQTMSQRETPHEMVGRVSSSFLSLIALSQVLGLLLSGYLAQVLGIRRLFIACAAVLALFAAGGHLKFGGKTPAAPD